MGKGVFLSMKADSIAASYYGSLLNKARSILKKKFIDGKPLRLHGQGSFNCATVVCYHELQIEKLIENLQGTSTQYYNPGPCALLEIDYSSSRASKEPPLEIDDSIQGWSFVELEYFQQRICLFYDEIALLSEKEVPLTTVERLYYKARKILQGVKSKLKKCLRIDLRYLLRSIIRCHFKNLSDCSGSDDDHTTVKTTDMRGFIKTFNYHNNGRSFENGYRSNFTTDYCKQTFFLDGGAVGSAADAQRAA